MIVYGCLLGEDGGKESPPSLWMTMGGAGIGSSAGGGGVSTGKTITGVGRASGSGLLGVLPKAPYEHIRDDRTDSYFDNSFAGCSMSGTL